MNPSENKTKSHPCSSNKEEEEVEQQLVFSDVFHKLAPNLTKETNWRGVDIYHFEGFWYPKVGIENLLYFRHEFEPHHTDILLASAPKSGTTWLKSLTFTIVNRCRYSFEDHPLLTTSPHRLVPFVNTHLKDYVPNYQPRLFSTHFSYSSIPTSIKSSFSENKIVYVCRNPLDQFISMYHFHAKLHELEHNRDIQVTIQEAFDKFCQGIHWAGPFWDHILEYWKASLERPDKVLFLQYEDMKEDNISCVKKLASFLGLPFSEEEEKHGLIQKISSFCSFESMKEFEANKGTTGGKSPIPNSAFYRKGNVGDFIDYLTLSMIEIMEQLMKKKFGDSGLSFKMPASNTQ